MEHLEELNKEIADHVITNIGDYIGTDFEELHNNMFNQDYYIYGTWNAKQWLYKYDVFDCIGLIVEYEKDNFREVNTDLTSPEHIVNMVVYIIGEEVLSNFNNCDYREITPKVVKQVIKYLLKKYKL